MDKEAERHIEAARLALISAQAGKLHSVTLLTDELAALLTRLDELTDHGSEVRHDIERDWP